MASIPFIYENIINNFNKYKTLILEKTIYAFQIKKIKLNNLRNIKKIALILLFKKVFIKVKEVKENKKELEHI